MSRRTCPTCAKRRYGLVEPDCAVCEGVGVIGLGTAGVHVTSPDVAARAIELYLESACRLAEQALPLDEQHDVLVAAVGRLREVGLLTAPIGVAEPAVVETAHPRVVDSHAARVAAQAGGVAPKAVDAANVDAPEVVYTEHDRPRASGLLPRTSRGGYPSALARIADPTDALGPDTRIQVFEQQAVTRQATALSLAVDPALAQRRRAR